MSGLSLQEREAIRDIYYVLWTSTPQGKIDRRKTHGLIKSPEYVAWQNMRTRCLSPNCINYQQYGGRGITVCDEWKSSFQAFFLDMGPKPSMDHTLDRIDVNGNYERTNCRWATREEQANNKTNSRFISIDGKTRTITEWSRLSGISRFTILARLKANWEPRRAIFHRRMR